MSVLVYGPLCAVLSVFVLSPLLPLARAAARFRRGGPA